ncbi:MAG: carbamoyl phosphate synthase small subunit [Lachnospiraceae bacterium]
MNDTIYLQLEDGTVFCGKSFGAPLQNDVVAEVVFTTAMTGYLETLTDPSYYGQMVVQTYPLIGNYGVIPNDYESLGIHLSAYIVKEYCTAPSNFRSRMDLDTFLKKEGIPGICDLDTRALTKKIRQSGVMNGRLSCTPPQAMQPKDLSSWTIQDAVGHVSVKEFSEIPCGIPGYHVVLWDFGAKQNIIRKLHTLNCRITVVPSSASCEQILSLNPDGIMLSNGPGNPKDNPSIIRELQKLCAYRLPTFGICLGHQLLALANGADTEKLKYGHRGANQPVKDITTGRIYITSQNHGYAVKNDSLPANAFVSYINLNDNTCEGVYYKDFPGFSVQFHPEACGGPHDTEFLFQQFIALMEGRKKECH